MSIFNKFAARWAHFKTYGDFKDHAASAAIGSLLAEQLNHHQAPNYLEMTFQATDGNRFVVNVRRLHGDSPHQLRKNAEAKAFELEQALRRLVAASADGAANVPVSLIEYDISLSKAKELLTKLDRELVGEVE